MKRGVEELGLIFWSFSSSVASGTPKSVLSEEDHRVKLLDKHGSD